jgi:hypothetical protein
MKNKMLEIGTFWPILSFEFISETVRESKSVNLLLEALNKINSKKNNFFLDKR